VIWHACARLILPRGGVRSISTSAACPAARDRVDSRQRLGARASGLRQDTGSSFGSGKGRIAEFISVRTIAAASMVLQHARPRKRAHVGRRTSCCDRRRPAPVADQPGSKRRASRARRGGSNPPGPRPARSDVGKRSISAAPEPTTGAARDMIGARWIAVSFRLIAALEALRRAQSGWHRLSRFVH